MPRASSHPEDNPREVLDLQGMFTVEGRNPPLPVTYDEIKDVLRRMREAGQRALRIDPVPNQGTLTLAEEAMGNGHNGVWPATIFQPPIRLRPSDVFEELPINTMHRDIRLCRYCIRRLPFVLQETGASLKAMAIFVSGAYRGVTDESRGVNRGGWAFTCKKGWLSNHAGALEKRGPSNDPPCHMSPDKTANRAALRGALAALTSQPWYVVQGATEWLRPWADPAPGRRPWSSGDAAAGAGTEPNRDLWERLMELLGEYAQTGGCEVSFWLPRRSWINTEGLAAGEACRMKWEEYYADITNPMV